MRVVGVRLSTAGSFLVFVRAEQTAAASGQTADRGLPVRTRRGVTALQYQTSDPTEYVFTVDIYGYRNHAPPRRHVGWWWFEPPRRDGTAELRMDFDPVRPESVAVHVGGNTPPAFTTRLRRRCGAHETSAGPPKPAVRPPSASAGAKSGVANGLRRCHRSFHHAAEVVLRPMPGRVTRWHE